MELRVLRGYRHAYLLGSLVLMILVRPFLAKALLGIVLFDVLLVLTLGTSVLACAVHRRQVMIGLGLAGATLLTRWTGAASGTASAISASSVLALLFFAFVTALLLRQVFFTTRRVSADTIAGALSAYLLLGIIWAFAYGLLETLLPDSFAFANTTAAQGEPFARFLSFSFVTLTTLGYGNVVPTNPRAEALATTQAIFGQVYLTVLVARLVALQIGQSRSEAVPAGDDPEHGEAA